MATSGMLPPPPSESEPWSEKDFAAIVAFLRHQIGITLEPHRMGLLQARLRSRVQVKGFSSFCQFHEQVLRNDPSGWGAQLLIDLSTVNHTSFFREPAHFTFLSEHVAASLKECTHHDGPPLVGRLLIGPGTVQHGHVPGGSLAASRSCQGRDLGQRPFAGDAQGRGRRDLRHARCAGRLSGPSAPVLPAGPRSSRGLVPDRARDPRPRQVPASGSA